MGLRGLLPPLSSFFMMSDFFLLHFCSFYAKDMKNNFIGSAYGVMHPKAGSCDKFLKKGK